MYGIITIITLVVYYLEPNVNLPYRQNVCMLIVNKENLLFLGERTGEKNHWQFPQGGVDPTQTLEENALREASEELGTSISNFHIIKKLEATHRYEFENPPPYAKDKYKGQDQTFWLLRFIGEDSDVRLDQHEKEFQSFMWATMEEVRKLAFPRRLAGYNAALLEFEVWLNGIKGE